MQYIICIQVPELVLVGSQAVRFFQSAALSPFSDDYFHVVWLLMLFPSQYTISAGTEMYNMTFQIMHIYSVWLRLVFYPRHSHKEAVWCAQSNF